MACEPVAGSSHRRREGLKVPSRQRRRLWLAGSAAPLQAPASAFLATLQAAGSGVVPIGIC
jgi:hypothetical protein